MRILKKAAFLTAMGLGACLFVFLLLISPFFVSPAINDIILGRFAKQLDTMDLRETAVVDTFSNCGHFGGAGNGMDFFACALVSTTLTYDELSAQVEAVPFAPAKTKSNGGATERRRPLVEILPVTGDSVEYEYLPYDDIQLDIPEDADGSLFVIVIFDSGYLAWHDLRGH